MAEQQQQQASDSDSPQQRKRIAVACGRCRKRKIRCSGDMGQGQPCLNCKNAGADQCLFLRVHAGTGGGDFGYSVSDARVLATRTPVAMPGTYPPDGLPNGDVLANSYRGSAGYAYPPTKSYYPAVSSYGPHYGAEEFDFQPLVSSDVAMMHPGSWSARKGSAYGSMYVDPSPSAYGGYGSATTPLVHRPAPSVSSDTTGPLSLSNFGADLPSTTSSDRVLPTPTRLPYPNPGARAPSSASPSSGPGTLADVAAAASYVASFEAYGAEPSSSASTHSSSHSQQHRSEYSSAGGAMFSDPDRSMDNGNPIDSYYSRRSDSLPSGTLSNGHTYIPPGEPLYPPVGHPGQGYPPRVGPVGSVDGRVAVAGTRV
ncbi:hypothetical protein B0T14DRAFT_536884 [Immersiella caudata]|uniref:Zn(2)-C6 fungal-type domain-containing protein n=1 Tax=Immersiella caudata TaxID=314043 RepID=A0AA39WNV0_9PEZI|nr:hypothetical protein B0T14DRAFT_536884 [Immersiella caudata]